MSAIAVVFLLAFSRQTFAAFTIPPPCIQEQSAPIGHNRGTINGVTNRADCVEACVNNQNLPSAITVCKSVVWVSIQPTQCHAFDRTFTGADFAPIPGVDYIDAACAAAGATTTAVPAATYAPVTFGTGVPLNNNCADIGGAQCPTWAAQSQCIANPYWMKINCAHSCNSCGVTKEMLDAQQRKGCVAQDKNSQCGFWAFNGECSRNPTYMLGTCPSSCGCPGVGLTPYESRDVFVVQG